MTVADTSIELDQGRPQSDHWHARSNAASDGIARTTAIFALVGIALIHFVQIVGTFEQSFWLGMAFLGLIVAAMTLAASLLGGGSRSAWIASALISILSISGYIFTRTVSTPFDNQDVGNWTETLGLAALFVEGLLAILSGYVVIATSRSRTTT